MGMAGRVASLDTVRLALLGGLNQMCGGCVQALYQKQGRSSQFKSRQERDQWINNEVAQLETTAAAKASTHNELEAQMQQLSSQLMDLSQVTHAYLIATYQQK